MNAVATVTAPVLSQSLYAAVRARRNPHPDAPPAPVGASLAEEAHRMALAYAERLRPASAAEWRAFLRPLVSVSRNPPSKNDFEAFISGASMALDTIPAHLLTPARQAEACRKFAFWPSVADLAEWLTPDAREEWTTLNALRRIAAERPDPTWRGPKTEDALASLREHAEGKVAEMKANLRASEAESKIKAPIKPAYLTDDQLIVILKPMAEAGNGPAKVRLAGLLARKNRGMVA